MYTKAFTFCNTIQYRKPKEENKLMIYMYNNEVIMENQKPL